MRESVFVICLTVLILFFKGDYPLIEAITEKVRGDYYQDEQYKEWKRRNLVSEICDV